MEDFNFDNILKIEILHKNVLLYEISNKNLIGAKPLNIRFDKIYGFVESVREIYIQCYLLLKNIMSVTIGLDTLYVKKLVSTLSFLTITPRLMLIHMILYLYKNIELG